MKQLTQEQIETMDYSERKNRELSTLIKRSREEAEISQLNITQKAGVARSYISEIESGLKKKPTYEKVVAIMYALGYEVEFKKIPIKEFSY